jgi:hypothetical protein
MKKAFPLWIIIVVIIETLPMFLGPYLAMFVPAAIPGLSGGEQVSFAASIYSARNLAVGVALVVALILRNEAMLFILILVRLLTDLMDFPTLLLLGSVTRVYLVTAIFVFLYYIPALFALRYLMQRLSAQQAHSAATN